MQSYSSFAFFSKINILDNFENKKTTKTPRATQFMTFKMPKLETYSELFTPYSLQLALHKKVNLWNLQKIKLIKGKKI